MGPVWADFSTSEFQRGFLGVPKIGLKLLLGKKSTLMVIMMSQDDDKKIHKPQDLVI